MDYVRLTINATRDPAGTPIVSESLSPEQVRMSLFRILSENVLCSIATVTPDHQAHINTVYFCYSDELEIYFLSHPNSLHCRNLATNPSMAMTIFSSSQNWGNPDQGLQLFGTCALAVGAQAAKAAKLYGMRFTAFLSWQSGLDRNDPGRDYRFYEFLISRVKVFDEKEWGKALFVEATVR